MYDLQNRWKLENGRLVYYGLRNPPNMLKNVVKLSTKQKEIIKKLPCELTEKDKKSLGSLLGDQIVERRYKKQTPKTFDEARFCVECAANDYMIPGLEFDENGRCPICRTIEKNAALKSVLPVKNEFPRSKRSRFDIALFYTGGKDSTYLLYYLSKTLGRRVLALTWEMPYMSETARKSIENAKKMFSGVEFISRRISDDDIKRIYTKLYELNGNTCACPSLAYLLFYPELVDNKVPYFTLGNEPSQMIGLYYNGMAPKVAYGFSENKLLNFMINAGRVLTLRPPLKKGQFHTLMTMKQLAYGDNIFKKLSGYENELVTNVVKALHAVPSLTAPLKRSIRRSSATGNIPSLVHIDLDAVCGGIYDWDEVKEILIKECGWVQPDALEKGLHTSCKIEKCKEHTQFIRFYNMQSRMIPFSALEISIASKRGSLSREQAVREIKNSLGFSLEEIPECALMKEYINI